MILSQHLNNSLYPSWLVVMLTCKQVGSSIVGSKLVLELNDRACVVDTWAAYVTAIHQDLANVLDPAVYSGSCSLDFFMTKLWVQQDWLHLCK